MVTFKILFLSKYPVNPLYPALKRLPYGPERQCNPVRGWNPAKGKPLLRQGTDGNFHGGPRVYRILTFLILLIKHFYQICKVLLILC